MLSTGRALLQDTSSHTDTVPTLELLAQHATMIVIARRDEPSRVATILFGGAHDDPLALAPAEATPPRRLALAGDHVLAVDRAHAITAKNSATAQIRNPAKANHGVILSFLTWAGVVATCSMIATHNRVISAIL